MRSYDYTISIGHLGEQLTLNQWVLGSSPRWCTTNSHTIYFVWLFLIVVAIFGGQLLRPLTWLIVSGLFCFSDRNSTNLRVREIVA